MLKPALPADAMSAISMLVTEIEPSVLDWNSSSVGMSGSPLIAVFNSSCFLESRSNAFALTVLSRRTALPLNAFNYSVV